jgi:predicted permease
MRQLFFDSYAEAKRGPQHSSILRFYVRAFCDLAAHAIRSRADRSTPVAMPKQTVSVRDDVAYRRVGLVESLNSAARNTRVALRGLHRSPGFSLVVLITLGLGIGASTAIFSVVDGILLSSLPYPDADKLVVLREQSPPPEVRVGWVSEPTFRDWRERTAAFDDIIAWRLNQVTLTDGGAPERAHGYVVSAGFFPTMGIEMLMGRGFLPDEDRPDGEKVVVISRALWQQRFGLDPDVLGKNLVMNGVSHTIVGVAGDSHKYPGEADIWSPIALEYEPTFRGFRYLGLIGRISSDVSLAGAQIDLDRVAAEVASQNQDTNAGWGAAIEPLKSTLVGRLQPVLVGMMVAVLLLLLIAVGNVANLFLARLTSRGTEVAIRRALGASRGSLARLFVTEATILSGFGCVLGIGVAIWGVKLLETLARGRLPRLDQIGIDGRVLAFALTLALIVGLILGLVPAVVSVASHLGSTLRSGTRSASGHGRTHRMREYVLTVQVSLAFALLVGASLLARSLWNLHQIDPGFAPENVVSFELEFPESRYDSERLRAVFPELLARIGGIPGVEATGYVHPMPMVLGSVPSRYAIQSKVGRPQNELPMAHPRMTAPGYFDAMSIPLLRGRSFNNGDGPNSQLVAVVNETFANRYLEGDDPIGQRITWSDPEDPDATWFTIVGVVGDVLFRRLTDSAEPEVYTPVVQTPYGFGQIVLRHQGPLEQLRGSMTEVFRSIDPDLAVARPLLAEETIHEGLGAAKLNTTLISFFAIVAGVLALVGVLGVLSILVSRRTREIGIRMVLGAQTGEITRFVLAKGLRPVVWGLLLGTAISVGLTRFLESQVYQTSTLDPLAFLLPSAAFLLTALIACQLPARRATRLDPASVLRVE